MPLWEGDVLLDAAEDGGGGKGWEATATESDCDTVELVGSDLDMVALK